ncbi:response regulator [Azospirillum sp. A39]|uniref:response regulator n=1 Tax=Azospirillum sp. A39 TaxID=3462279 RepID=UPI004045B0D1
MARIIVIDDDPPTLSLARALLERMGHTVDAVASGAEGIARFLERGADLVLTDLFMPDQDGLETLRRLKSLAPGLPVVCMSAGPSRVADTGQVRDTMLRYAHEAGADATLTKPLEIATMQRVIESVLSGAAGGRT